MEETYQRELGPSAKIYESHGEYHLPDYAGDIKKMLSSTARIVPTGKFFGEEEVQFGGCVHYDFWYLDAENALTHESFSSDYEFSCPHAHAKDGAIEVSILQFSLRPSGPRRLSAKATVEGRITLRAPVSYVCECDNEEKLYKKHQKIWTGQRIFSAPMEREYAESIPVPAQLQGQNAEILFSEAHVRIEHTEAQDGAVAVRGNVVFAAVLRAAALAPIRICESFPIEEQIPCEGGCADMSASVAAFITSLTADIREDAECSVTFSSICEFSCTAEKNQPLSVVEDAFVEHREASLENESLHYDTFGYSKTFLGKADLKLPFSSIEDGGADGVFHASVVLKDALICEGEYRAQAEVTALVYSLSEDGTIAYGVRRGSTPFSLPLADLGRPEGEVASMCRVLDCEGHIEDDALCVCTSVQLTVRCSSQHEISCVRRILCASDEKEAHAPFFALHYPEAGDCLWSVAKRYAVSPQTLAVSNHIDASSENENTNLPSPLLVDCRKR